MLYRGRDCTCPAQVAELCQLFSSRLNALDNDAIFTASIKHKHRTKRVIKHVEFPHAEEVPLACFTFFNQCHTDSESSIQCSVDYLYI